MADLRKWLAGELGALSVRLERASEWAARTADRVWPPNSGIRAEQEFDAGGVTAGFETRTVAAPERVISHEDTTAFLAAAARPCPPWCFIVGCLCGAATPENEGDR